MEKNKLEQKGGENSTNNLATTITNNYSGISYADAREIAIDVYKSNALHLAGIVANDIANNRMEWFIDKLLANIREKNPTGIDSFCDPGLQHALFTAQKEYARTGDKDLADILVDLLIDRTSLLERDLKQIVIDESINVVSKLTSNQLDTLTIAFLLHESRFAHIQTLEDLIGRCKKIFEPFSQGLSSEVLVYKHIEYCGCAGIGVRTSNNDIEKKFLNYYKGLFSKGLTKQEIHEILASSNDEVYSFLQKYLIICFHDPVKVQLGFLDNDNFDRIIEEEISSNEDIALLKKAFRKNIFTEAEVKSWLISQGEYMEKIFNVWEKSYMCVMRLTSVGIVLAQANYRSKTGEVLDLGMWIK